MKLATLRDGTRDGMLIIVDRTLSRYVTAINIVPNLQTALDQWAKSEPQLCELAARLEMNEVAHTIAFDPHELHAPLPRAYQWADCSAYVNHVELVRRARGAEMPDSFWTEPLIYQGGSDSFLGPTDDIVLSDADWGIDFEAEVAIITDDVPMGVCVSNAATHIKLFMLVNDVSLRHLIPLELAKGFGFFQSKPSTAFSPVAVTKEELGTAWDGHKLHLPLHSFLNDELFGFPNAGRDMTFDFAQLIAHAAKTRPLTAGTIIGSGTVSNKQNTDIEKNHPGRPVKAGGRGYSCIAEQRMVEIIETGAAKTPFLQFGDHIQIRMYDDRECDIFGEISQTVTAYQGPS